MIGERVGTRRLRGIAWGAESIARVARAALIALIAPALAGTGGAAAESPDAPLPLAFESILGAERLGRVAPISLRDDPADSAGAIDPSVACAPARAWHADSLGRACQSAGTAEPGRPASAGRLTERVSLALPDDSIWHLRPLGGRRFLADGGEGWLLVGDEFRERARGRGTPVGFDAQHDRFFVLSRTGLLDAYAGRSGDLRARLGLELFAREVVALRADARRIAVASVARTHPEVSREVASHLQAFAVPDLDARTVASPDMPIAPTPIRHLRVDGFALRAAVDPTSGGMLVACDGAMAWLGPDLDVLSIVTGRFEPGWIAVDDAGRALLVVRDAQGRAALWRVARDGRRSLAAPISIPDPGTGRGAEPEPTAVAIAVGFDGSIVLALGDRLLELGAPGARSVEQKAPAPIVGLTVDRTGRVWVSTVESIEIATPRSRDAAWQRVATLADVASAPLPLADGSVAVAAGGRLVLLAPALPRVPIPDPQAAEPVDPSVGGGTSPGKPTSQ